MKDLEGTELEDYVVIVIPGKINKFRSGLIFGASVIVTVENGVSTNYKNKCGNIDDCVGTINKLLNLTQPENKS